MTEGKGKVVIYDRREGGTQIEVRLEDDSLWLSQKVMADLFEKDTDTIGLHIKNIYAEEELQEQSTAEIFPVVQQEGNRKVKRNIKFYNLDVILSVGYRVSSKRGTAFRIWANQVLKDYLVKGYSLNEKKLQEKTEQYEGLKKAVALIANVTVAQALSSDEATGLLKILTDYTYALDVLDKYDHQVLEIEATSPKQLFQITYDSSHFKGHWPPFTKHLVVQTSTPAWKKKQPTCYIS
jgi:hypothetical protein